MVLATILSGTFRVPLTAGRHHGQFKGAAEQGATLGPEKAQIEWASDIRLSALAADY